MKTIQQLLEELPPELQKEARDFVESLLARSSRKDGEGLRQDWAGVLKDYRDKFTALGLQKKASEWRGD